MVVVLAFLVSVVSSFLIVGCVGVFGRIWRVFCYDVVGRFTGLLEGFLGRFF